MKATTFLDGLRNFFIMIDKGVYSLLGTVYEIIISIAENTLFNDTTVSDMANKLYSFIGIFMLFKLSFSLINYIVNPDTITDKEKGGSKIIVNIIISFLLMIVTPLGFKLLYSAQTAILEDNVIPNIIVGGSELSGKNNPFIISEYCEEKYGVITLGGDFDDDGEKFYNLGVHLSMLTIKPFFQIDESIEENSIKDFIGSSDGYSYCKASNVKELLRQTVVNYDTGFDGYYIIDYSVLVSTIFGFVLVLIFVGFCLDVALRSVKLAFLQVIAPIPIMSYIDPVSSKNGIFSKWLKEVGKTWADLFLRLIAIYFALFLITNIEWQFQSNWVTLFMIIGILMFAKKLPDILKSLLNVDLKGDFKLNPFKRIQDEAFGGKLAMGAATGLASGALGLATSFRGNNMRERFKNAGKGFTAGLKGGWQQPSTLKGLRAGRVPYQEIRKKEKEEQRKAEEQLREFDRFAKKGEKLIMDSRERDANGNLIVEEGKDGSKHYKISAKSKADQFTNDEYKKSFLAVDAAKKELKEGKKEYDEAQNTLNRLINDPNATNAQIEEAQKNVTAARENVEKQEGILSGVKERHKIVQQKYKDDAMKENAMKEFMDRNPDALNVKVNNNSTNNGVSSVTSNPNERAASTNRANDSENFSTENARARTNNRTGSQRNELSNNSRTEFKNYDEIIKNKEREIAQAREEYSQYSNKYGEMAERERNELAREISRMEADLEQTKLEKIKAMEANPEEAEEELKFQEQELNEEVREATERFNSADERLQSFNSKATGNYVAGEDYQKADREFDKAHE